MTSPARTIAADASCAEAARRMRDAGISSLLVHHADGAVGIVTDRDLRNRVVAPARDPTTPVGEVATRDAWTVTERTPVFEVMAGMLARGVHHAPVTRGDEVVGVVSAGDLMRFTARGPFHLQRAIDRAEDREALAQTARLLPTVLEPLVAAGARGLDLTGLTAAVADRITVRAVALAEAALGRPSGPYAWLALGSHARREQTPGSDADHALLLADGTDPAWAAALAEHVTATLEACGFRRCPGGVMATEARWRHDAGGWARLLRGFYDRPDASGLLGAQIGLDQRQVAGELDADAVMAPLLRAAADAEIFLAWLARDALRATPPLRRFGRWDVDREGPTRGTFDLKVRLLAPVQDLARVHALAAGVTAPATRDRLLGAADAGLLSTGLAQALVVGLDLLTRLRVTRHLQLRADGAEPDDRLAPGDLDPLGRAELKELCRTVTAAQEAAAQRYAGARLS